MNTFIPWKHLLSRLVVLFHRRPPPGQAMVTACSCLLKDVLAANRQGRLCSFLVRFSVYIPSSQPGVFFSLRSPAKKMTVPPPSASRGGPLVFCVVYREKHSVVYPLVDSRRILGYTRCVLSHAVFCMQSLAQGYELTKPTVEVPRF